MTVQCFLLFQEGLNQVHLVFYIPLYLCNCCYRWSWTVLGPLFGSFLHSISAFILVALKTFEINEQALPLNMGQLERILFGLFIILFLIFEPRGLWELFGLGYVIILSLAIFLLRAKNVVIYY